MGSSARISQLRRKFGFTPIPCTEMVISVSPGRRVPRCNLGAVEGEVFDDGVDAIKSALSTKNLSPHPNPLPRERGFGD